MGTEIGIDGLHGKTGHIRLVTVPGVELLALWLALSAAANNHVQGCHPIQIGQGL
jgi:hypothetical protein